MSESGVNGQKKISDLPAGAPVSLNDILLLVQGFSLSPADEGLTVRVMVSDLVQAFSAGLLTNPAISGGVLTGTEVSQATAQAVLPGRSLPERTLQQRFSEEVHLHDFGAAGYGVGDSAPAFNALATYIRNFVGTNSGATLKVNIPNDFYFCHSPVSFTNINATGSILTNSVPQVVIEFNGAWLVGCFNGGIVFDHFGSNALKVFNLNVTNGGSIPGYGGVPSLGIAGGVSSSANLGICNNHEFYNPAVIGNFSLSCAYWISTETTAVYNARFYNTSGNASSYCNITDGQNHFGVSSTTSPQQLPADTANSFNSMTFVQPDFRHQGAGLGRWMGATSAHRYLGGYIAVAAAVPSTILWQSQTSGGGVANLDLYDDVHVETSNCTDVYEIAGPQVAPPLYGLTYIDPGPHVSNSIFKCAAGITSVYATDNRVKLVGYANGALKMWDNAALWSWTGEISVPNGGNLCNTLPTQFQGRLAVGHQEEYFVQQLTIGLNQTDGPVFVTGNGAPSAVLPRGSQYSRKDGGVGTTLYISQGGGTWNAVSGV